MILFKRKRIALYTNTNSNGFYFQWLFFVIITIGFYSSLFAETAATDTLAHQLLPAIVRIDGYMPVSNGEAEYEKFAEGSGFFMERAGFVLTAYSVFVEPEKRILCEEFEIICHDKQVLKAGIFAVDPVLDLAILKLSPVISHPILKASAQKIMPPGEPVTAIAGKRHEGEVVTFNGQVKAPEKNSVYEHGCGDLLINVYMELPAYAYGGPLINNLGEAVGINVPYNKANMNEDAIKGEEHPVPIRDVKAVFKVLMTYPTYDQNWLGFSARRLTKEERLPIQALITKRDGVVADFVWENSPAIPAGIRKGDVVTKINGKRILTSTHFRTLVFRTERNTQATLTIVRDGAIITQNILVEKHPIWAAP